MQGIGDEPRRPPATTVIDRAEQVDARDVPGIDQQVHPTGVCILPLVEIAARIAQGHDRDYSFCAGPLDQGPETAGVLIEDAVRLILRCRAPPGLSGRARHDALVAERERKHREAWIDGRQIPRVGFRRALRLEPRRDRDGVVAAPRPVQHLPATRLEQRPHPAGVAPLSRLVAGPVGHRGAEKGDAVFAVTGVGPLLGDQTNRREETQRNDERHQARSDGHGDLLTRQRGGFSGSGCESYVARPGAPCGRAPRSPRCGQPGARASPP